ncbi:glutamate racemase [Candidatus Thiothrix sp. Deng01]|uniref:Glutamate racemase n=1 Tax=Candidatus Thiothrix phosphatis TaxID=3112415 RepID=A0ABU6CRD9_9GAMM|nr:glutamate racemase [Candidatus Thiothrix sp. Deng01]MEB4589408.1 glutamate racemase [Candidatus Thiothrix sp. Deng01]
MLSQLPIGVFDSGLGGISVLREIHRLLPAEDLIYVADSGHAPYGGKEPDYIRHRSQRVAEFLLGQGAKVLVVACNTATVHAVEFLRATLPIPVVGIEPAVKPAAHLTQTGVIGVLATQQTVNSPRLHRLIKEHAGHVEVITQACPGLVEHVEAGDFSSEDLMQLLKHYTLPLLEAGADVLVLGCTHYPFLSDAIHVVTHGRMTVLETSTPVTHQLMRVLDKHALRRGSAAEGDVRFYSSREDEQHFISMQTLWRNHINLALLPAPYG